MDPPPTHPTSQPLSLPATKLSYKQHPDVRVIEFNHEMIFFLLIPANESNESNKIPFGNDTPPYKSFSNVPCIVARAVPCSHNCQDIYDFFFTLLHVICIGLANRPFFFFF